MSKRGIVNIRMVITEEKILSNIDKVEKLINPNSKKQIVQLDEDSYFKDLIESIKTYLIEYPKKKNFPKTVYKAAYGLVEYATNQFEENTKQIEDLIRQREKNIVLSGELKELLDRIENKENNKECKALIKNAEGKFGEDIIDALGVIGRSKSTTSNNYQDAVKLINARIVNLESNLHIEIDMERIEDRSKALSYIGIEVADALKVIPVPVDYDNEDEAQQAEVNNVTSIEDAIVDENIAIENEIKANSDFINETRIDVKPSLWSRIKSSKIARALGYIFNIKVGMGKPELPEGRGE